MSNAAPELLASLAEETRRLSGQVESLKIALHEERRRGRRLYKALRWMLNAALGRKGAVLTEAIAAATQVVGEFDDGPREISDGQD